MTLQDIKNLASEKALVWTCEDLGYDGWFIFNNKQVGPILYPDHDFNAIDADHAERLRVALEKLVRVCECYEEAMWFVKSELLDQDKIYNHPLHSLEDRLEEALTRGAEIMKGEG